MFMIFTQTWREVLCVRVVLGHDGLHHLALHYHSLEAGRLRPSLGAEHVVDLLVFLQAVGSLVGRQVSHGSKQSR